MPNHVTNILKFHCTTERFVEIANFLKGGEDKPFGTVDFNTVIPMPDYIFRGNLGIEEKEKYGKDNWYDWSIEHWGTKWNAYDCVVDIDPELHTLEFYTAWNCVVKVIDEISKTFPDVIITYKWADEDFGYNVGKVKVKNGRGSVLIPDGGTNEAIELAAEVQGVTPEEWGYTKDENGDYQYNEDADGRYDW